MSNRPDDRKSVVLYGTAEDVLSEAMTFEVMMGGFCTMQAPYHADWMTFPYTVFSCVDEADQEVWFDTAAPVKVPVGDMVLCSSGMSHRFEIKSTGRFRTTWLVARFLIHGAIDICDLYEFPHVVRAGQAGRFRIVLADLLHNRQQRKGDWFARERILSGHLLAHLMDIGSERPQTRGRIEAAARIAPTLHYLRQNLGSPIACADLARHACMSRTLLFDVFREATGRPPMDYLIDLRLHNAQVLLRTTDDSIQAISERVGFQDCFHFSRTFKKRFHLSPSAYRKQPILH